MSDGGLCYTRIGDIPWFTAVAERADFHLSTVLPEELSAWYVKLKAVAE